VRGEALPALPAAERRALAELPPLFSQKRMAGHVLFLSSPDLEGRGLGSEGERRAAAYIAERFEEAGLLPAGDEGGYFQRFTVNVGPEGGSNEIANVAGYLPGSREEWKGQSVVVGAHYDHLGRGWPDVHAGDEGKIHPGADDNASGVALLLELARNIAEEGETPRDLVFVAFGGEEAGRLGSRHFVEHPGRFDADGIRGMINIDTVGRLFDKPLTVLATGTADEWPHIFRGCSYVTGVESRNVNEPLDSSDQESFIEKGIPAVQIFTRPHADYHRPSDTPDKVDMAGLVKVATFVKEAVGYLVQREEPLTARIGTKPEHGAGRHPSGPTPGKRVSFGSIPEFSFPGPGVQLSGVVPGSPAEAAGLREGDVLLRIDDQEISNLRQFSNVLKSVSPGQTVKAVVRRGEEILEFDVTVVVR
jgi:hypothetical protein